MTESLQSLLDAHRVGSSLAGGLIREPVIFERTHSRGSVNS